MNHVIITIDTEGHSGSNPVESLIYGITADGKEYGIRYIMDMCENYGVKALFFVDIAAAWDYGDEKIKQVVKEIKDRGHDIGIHIHPDHMADKKRLFLSEYNWEEQTEIIKQCTKWYENVTGELPKSFRAGKYSANLDTLKIISQLGYTYDFSYFKGQKWCGIQENIAGIYPKKVEGIYEIPVTVFNSFEVAGIVRYDKIDVNMNFHELKRVMKRIEKSVDGTIVVLFLHSFSFLNWRKNPSNPTVNKHAIRKFEKSLKLICDSKKLEFIGENNIEKYITQNEVNNKETKSIKNGNVFIQFVYSFLRICAISPYNRKAQIILLSMVLILILGGVLIFK